MNIGVILLLSAGLIFSADRVCSAGSAAGNIKKGNQMYYQGKFDEALKCYNKARAEKPDSAIIDFNTGAALYRKKDYPKAADVFTKALAVENHDLEAKASYNMGNSKYRIGKSKVNTDLSNAVSLYKQALGYYKRAIELDTKNTDAKYNYEFVEKELKSLLDKLKHQKQKKKQQQSNNQKQKKQSSQKSKSGAQKKQQPKQPQSKKQQRAQSKAEQQQKKNSRKKKQSQQSVQSVQGKIPEQRKQQAQPMQGGQKEMSEQEARMILKRCEQQEISASGMVKNKKRGYYPPVLKDW